MRTARLRQNVKKYLLERGEASSTEISEHVNSTMRHGATMQQLGNILAKDRDIVKVGTTRKSGALSGRYEMCIWSLKPEYISQADETPEELATRILTWLEKQNPGFYQPKQIKNGINTHVIPSKTFTIVSEEAPEWLSIEKGNTGRLYKVLPRS